ncbi:MAG: sialidase family protein [Candidatus Dormibacteria bacterium]
MKRNQVIRVAAAGFAGAVVGMAIVPLGTRAGGPNTWDEYTVRTANGQYFPDGGTAATTSAMSGGEPSVSYDTVHNNALYGSGTQVKRLTFDSSSPAEMTVTDVKPTTAVTTLDAITIVDPYAGRSFNSQLAGGCSLTSFSDDAGATWTPSQGCGFNTLLDHQTLGAGPFLSALPKPPAPAYPDAVYYCAQNGFNEDCAVSLDGGATFGQGVPIANTPANDPLDSNATLKAEGGACSALTGHVRVAPDGTAYVPLKGCGGTPTTQEGTNTEYQGGTPALSVSTDMGQTWTITRVPAASVSDGNGGANTVENPDESDPSVGISRQSGVLYYGWENGHNPPDQPNVPPVNGDHTQAMIAVSHDHGATWTNITDISSQLGVHNVQFPEVIAGDDDKAAFAFLGTADIGDDQTNAFPTDQPWHLYIATTYDGGKTWSTTDATPVDFMQRGCVDMQGTTIAPSGRTDICNQRNMLDFNDITMDGAGRVIVATSDGCNATCQASSTSHSSGAVDRVFRQSGGTFLLAGSSPNVPEGPLALLLPVLGGAASAAFAWRRRTRRQR